MLSPEQKIKAEYEQAKKEYEQAKGKYEQKLAALHAEQNRCIHFWDEVKYDAEELEEPVYETRWQGVDCFPVLVGTKPVRKDRWSRTCKKCGKVEYTYQQVAVQFAPKF